MDNNKTYNSIVFIDQDNPMSAARLQAALSDAGDIPVIGIVVKIEKEQDGRERIVNWMFADANFVKSLALVLPS
ncbi:MAG: hypothetical protein HYR70_04245 [Chloroflexi bacterium]|nr:hypothetical protein [Chloroflexota bacterium]MBI3340767.1 hypothetical protein [Chloroflexota bacterium]